MTCRTCSDVGWIVEGQTIEWPYGEQVQCPECESREDLQARIDEAEEKIAYLSEGCLRLSYEELVQKITEVTSARWQAGHWLSQKIDAAHLEDRAIAERARDAYANHYWEGDVSRITTVRRIVEGV